SEIIHEKTSTFKPEEWDNIQDQIEADEELAHKLQAQEGEGSEPAEESKDKELQLSQEQLQQLIIIVPEEGMNIEALQTKYPIIEWENFDRDDLVKLWDLVRERFSSTEPTDDKERALWVELKRLLVEQHSEMANELLRKIFIQANSPIQ
ncbi:hypothetical protein Tco_1231117, partial [Tanacetum coccineum]